MRIVKPLVGASVALWAAAAGAQLAEPVHVRNLNPLVSIFGLPAWDTVPIGTKFGVTPRSRTIIGSRSPATSA